MTEDGTAESRLARNVHAEDVHAEDVHAEDGTVGDEVAASDADVQSAPPRSLERGTGLIFLAVLALAVGAVIGTVSGPEVPAWVAPYLPIAVVAALDAVFGGVRAFLDGIFDSKVFVVSFVFNVVVAALIVWLGDQLGVGTQLSTAIVVVLGIRIFGNAAAVRRHLFGA